MPFIPLQVDPASLPQKTTYDDGLVVYWHYQRAQTDEKSGEQTVEFRGGVEAIYGPTHLYADNMKLNLTKHIGDAFGQIRIVDPEAQIRGAEFHFNWELRTGSVKQAYVQIERLQLKSDTIDITPEEWKFHNVYATTSAAHRPDFAARARDLKLTPGKGGVAYRPSIQLFGRWLGSVPYMRFSLNDQVAGFRLPAISFRRGQGVGLGWLSGFNVTEKSSVFAAVAAFPKVYPSTNINYTYAPTSAGAGGGFVTPRSDLGIRFQQNYLDDIENKTPASEEAFYSTRRRSYTLTSAFNLGTEGRIADVRSVSKPIEATLETTGLIGNFGSFNQLRLQTIRDTSAGKFGSRIMELGAVRSPQVRLAGLQTRARLDYLASTGAGTSFFGWGRFSAGALKDVSPRLRLGAEAYFSRQFGTPAYSMDRLVSERGFLFRGDLALGPLKASGIAKYDFDLHKGYDTEWLISYACGSFEPFILVKQNPKTYSFGVRLRAEDIIDRLTHTAIERQKH